MFSLILFLIVLLFVFYYFPVRREEQYTYLYFINKINKKNLFSGDHPLFTKKEKSED